LDLVLGGTFDNLPYARRVTLPRNALLFDPVSGLFGLVPARNDGPIADPDVRRLLAQAIDREALIAALDVAGLVGRGTILEAGLEGIPDPATPTWMSVPIGERRPSLIAAGDRLFGGLERPTLSIELPDGPGANIVFNRLASDWALVGVQLQRAEKGARADLRLVDAVAPSNSPAWYLRQFRCGQAPICDAEADKLLDGARAASVAPQRAALLSEAARRIDDLQLFLPIAAPIRWSLVSARIEGFAGNRFARHTLTALEEKLTREGGQ
jgi:peptide/nickel transport system substrate-binding protein